MQLTKDRILETLLEAFNTIGYEALSIRNMADQVGISHGNLRYHFQKKEEILLALLQRMVAEMDQLKGKTFLSENILEQLFKGIEGRFAIQYRYRFLFIEQSSLARESEVYKEYLQNLYKERTVLMQNNIMALVNAGVLVPDAGELLAKHLFLFSVNWLNSHLIYSELEAEQAINYFAQLCFDHFKPYLNSQGKTLYNTIDFGLASPQTN